MTQVEWEDLVRENHTRLQRRTREFLEVGVLALDGDGTPYMTERGRRLMTDYPEMFGKIVS